MDMKVNSVVKAYGVNEISRLPTAGRLSRAEEKRDLLALSLHAKEYDMVRNALRNTPDVRDEAVNAVRQKIDDNRYNVSAADVAEKIVNFIYQ